MPGFQRIEIIGNVGREPELRYTPSGTAVASISVAVNRRRQDENGEWQDDTTWFTCVAWRDLAERISDDTTYGYARKGRLVRVEGRMMKPRVYQNKQGEWTCSLEIDANAILMLDRLEEGGNGGQETRWQEPPARRPAADGPASAEPPAPSSPPTGAQSPRSDDFDDLPF